ncbi:hypothetical protein OBRU01_20317, partial [Operophtera brumata]
ESKLVVGEQHGTERALTPTKDELTGAGFKALLTKHRENIHSVLAYSNATPIRCYSGMGYACVFCAHQHRDPAALKRHTRTEHITENYKIKHLRSHLVKLDVTGLKCSICNTKFVALESFMRHLKSKHDKPMHFDIKNHIVPYKFDKIDLECVKCGKLFNNFKNISEHMNNIHFRNYECDKCPRGFVNKNTLMTHGSNHKTGEFPCDYCRKIFRTRLRKREHERTLHIHNSKTRKCGYCPERFIDVAQKINHEVLVHKAERQQFSCTECKGKFTSPRLLRHHKKKQHFMHKCVVEGCDKTFFLNAELLLHLKTHGDERPFTCALCPKTYKSKKALVVHMNSHEEQRQFLCKVCKKLFLTKENLDLHLEKIHYIQ